MNFPLDFEIFRATLVAMFWSQNIMTCDYAYLLSEFPRILVVVYLWIYDQLLHIQSHNTHVDIKYFLNTMKKNVLLSITLIMWFLLIKNK